MSKTTSQLCTDIKALATGQIDHFYVNDPKKASHAHVYAKHARICIFTQREGSQIIVALDEEKMEEKGYSIATPGAGTALDAIRERVGEHIAQARKLEDCQLLNTKLRQDAKRLRVRMEKHFARL